MLAVVLIERARVSVRMQVVGIRFQLDRDGKRLTVVLSLTQAVVDYFARLKMRGGGFGPLERTPEATGK